MLCAGLSLRVVLTVYLGGNRSTETSSPSLRQLRRSYKARAPPLSSPSPLPPRLRQSRRLLSAPAADQTLSLSPNSFQNLRRRSLPPVAAGTPRSRVTPARALRRTSHPAPPRTPWTCPGCRPPAPGPASARARRLCVGRKHTHRRSFSVPLLSCRPFQSVQALTGPAAYICSCFSTSGDPLGDRRDHHPAPAREEAPRGAEVRAQDAEPAHAGDAGADRRGLGGGSPLGRRGVGRGGGGVASGAFAPRTARCSLCAPYTAASAGRPRAWRVTPAPMHSPSQHTQDGAISLAGVPLPSGRHTRFTEEGFMVTEVVHAVRPSVQ